MNTLTHIVECKSTYPFWEIIAAFDGEFVADNYARECARSNPTYKYRVRSAELRVAATGSVKSTQSGLKQS